MAQIPVVKGKRQGEWCVSWYALAKEPINDLHGFYIMVGTYDDEAEAEKEGKRVRLAIKNIGGRVKVHRTGHYEPLLGDDADYAANRKKVSEDAASMHSIKHQEELEKRRKEKEEIDARQRELEEEQTMFEDPNSIESYAQLHVRRRMLEETLVSQEHNLIAARKKLEELHSEITDSDTTHPTFKDEWRAFIKQKIGTDQIFILQERTDSTAPPVDIEGQIQAAVDSAREATA